MVRHLRGPGLRGPAPGLPPLEVQGARLSDGRVPADWPRAGLGGGAAWAPRRVAPARCGAPLGGLRRGPGQR
eukprot:7520950-Alexandrium_andersonii.AAC.1